MDIAGAAIAVIGAWMAINSIAFLNSPKIKDKVIEFVKGQDLYQTHPKLTKYVSALVINLTYIPTVIISKIKGRK